MQYSRKIQFPINQELTLVAEAWGQVAQPTVLFLHGGGQQKTSWGKTAGIVAAAGWQAVALDLRGHGESDWSQAGDYSVEAFMHDLKSVVQQLGAPAVIVGASLGGAVALLASAEFTDELCRALVLVDIAPQLEAKGLQRILGFVNKYKDGFESLAQAADAISAYRGRAIRDPQRYLRKNADGRYRWHWDPRLVQAKCIEQVQESSRLISALRHITVPLLLVRGAMSDVVGEAAIDEFDRAVGAGKIVEVKGAGHTVAGDSNEKFTDAILSFLESL